MAIFKKREGQTLIETALVLFLLLLIVLGITEFSRAWYTKSSLKNAARTGARVAVVTTGISNDTRSYADPGDCASLNGNDRVFCYIWSSPGIKPRPTETATATLTISDVNGNGAADAGETVSVSTTKSFNTVVPRIMGTFIPSQLSADASMRYE